MAVGRIVSLAILGVLALPGLLINVPAVLFVRSRAQKEAVKATKASSVKIAGRDVIASYKVTTM